MEREEIIKYIKDPQELNEYSFSELRALLKKYPYFQTAHQLLLLNSWNINDPRFKEFLKHSAVYLKERKKFFRLVNELETIKATGNKDLSPYQDEKADSVKKGTKPGRHNQGADEIKSEVVQVDKDKIKKEKDYSTAYLKERISNTLSVQKEDSTEKKEEENEGTKDFFILDKASQVEEKMSRKLKEKFEKKEPEEEKNTPSEDGNFSKESDSFELDNTDDAKGEETQSKKKSSINIQGEYFTEEDYRKTLKDKENKNEDLIDKFIQKFPEMENIHPKKGNEPNEDISLPSVEENEEIYSEKLIGIFVQQGYYEKAISAYEKLSLKYPKKSDYFAGQIEKLKEIINKQQK